MFWELWFDGGYLKMFYGLFKVIYEMIKGGNRERVLVTWVDQLVTIYDIVN